MNQSLDGAKKNTLADHFSLQERYQSLYQSYLNRGVSRVLDENDKEFTSGESWTMSHYFNVGADAIRIIISALLVNGREPPSCILDLPSGSGRVTRHLKSIFPTSKIVACDLYEYHVDFCVRELGVQGFVSNEDFNKIRFETDFDLIFCGSLLTHLPGDQFKSALSLLSNALSENGIAVFTLHGRHSIFVQDNKWKYIKHRLFNKARSAYNKRGFGYVDYATEVKMKFSKQARYGISLSKPSWVMKRLEDNEAIRILGYVERGWDDHQGVLVVGRPGVNE